MIAKPWRLCFSTPKASDFDMKMVEMMGFEPMTPCLQGRCSPN